MGYPVSDSLKHASEELCRSVLLAYGGMSAIANSLDWDRRRVFHYIKVGHVHLESVYEISKLLNLSPWVFSYHILKEAFGENSPSFSKIVNSCPLLPAEKKRLIKLSKEDK